MTDVASLAATCAPLHERRFDDSRALIWFKDLNGRYLQVNRRYAEVLATSEERLVGRSDSELPAHEVVDGPRLLSNGGPAAEPLQLEYTIPAFELRPALSVLRFPVRDGEGEPLAVCGVAAPLEEAHLARAECARLMELERAGRAEAKIDPVVVAPEIESAAEPVQVAAIPEPQTAEPGADGAELHQLISERDALLANAAELERELGEGRRRIAALHEASATAARRAHELMSALAQEQERSAALESALECAHGEAATEPEAGSASGPSAEELREELARVQSALQDAHADGKQAQYELQQAHASLQRARADAQATRAQLAQARGEARRAADAVLAERRQVAELSERLRHAYVPGKLHWDAGAQRALSAALASASEWRMGLKDVIKVLGSEGGWDAVIAWAPGERSTLRCVAMWMRDPDRHPAFETLTWQRPEPLTATELGRASAGAHAVSIDRLEGTDDHRLKAAAAEGMRCAALVPIRDGVSTLALIELLSVEREAPERELLLALEAIALQLGHFAHLLRLGARPHWRFGRV